MKEIYKNIQKIDPRIYQISILTLLLGYNVGWLDFSAEFAHIVLIISSALATQLFFIFILRLNHYDLKSPLISSLSLCLLLRTNSLLLMAFTAFVTIASKFIFRWRNKHIFNPTNFGLVAMMALTGQIWVSPGQWGSTAYFSFLLACLGGLVITRAARADVSLAFLFFYSSILFIRAAWLGDPWQIPLHQLQNGALLLFVFFMISDPKTTPDSRNGRIFFAFLVACGASFIQFVLYEPNGLLWSLAICSIFTPLIDYFFPGQRYTWSTMQLNIGEQS